MSQPETEEQMVNDLFHWLTVEAGGRELGGAAYTFFSKPRESLINYHHTLGQSIRDQYRLWERKWEPDLRDGIDYSPDHPDAVSQRVIEKTWEKIQVWQKLRN